jgi:hypothetical protein
VIALFISELTNAAGVDCPGARFDFRGADIAVLTRAVAPALLITAFAYHL